MKRLILSVLLVLTFAVTALASTHKLPTAGTTEFSPGNAVQVFAPDPLLDTALTVKVTAVLTEGFISWQLSSPVDCKVYKSYSSARNVATAIPVWSKVPVFRGVGLNAKYAIMSGCTGGIFERH